MFCSKCGKLVPKSYDCCMYDAKLEFEFSDANIITKNKNKSIAIILFLLISCIGIFMAYNTLSKDNEYDEGYFRNTVWGISIN